jgi:predicted nucleic acid-binding protein
VKTIVSDTGPVLHLLEAESLELLSGFGTVLIPMAVHEELNQLSNHWTNFKPAWLHTIPLEEPYLHQSTLQEQLEFIDYGESQAISLFFQTHADMFLTDDATARIYAQSLGIEVHGSIGIILSSAAQKRLTKSETIIKLDKLSQTSLWISKKVLQEAYQAVNKIFP